jgi:hypothetical protein
VSLHRNFTFYNWQTSLSLHLALAADLGDPGRAGDGAEGGLINYLPILLSLPRRWLLRAVLDMLEMGLKIETRGG